jgi:hypothetical protein
VTPIGVFVVIEQPGRLKAVAGEMLTADSADIEAAVGNSLLWQLYAAPTFPGATDRGTIRHLHAARGSMP